jgi:hypothetical protein
VSSDFLLGVQWGRGLINDDDAQLTTTLKSIATLPAKRKPPRKQG